MSTAKNKRGRNINFAGDVNAVVSTSTGGSGVSRTSVRSRRRIVQRSGETVVNEKTASRSKNDDRQSDLARKELRQEDAESLPEREGTLDKLRNEASERQEGTAASEDAPEIENPESSDTDRSDTRNRDSKRR